ncbi:MAG: methyltransferase domain-containing protein [Rhodovibrionaceae bacterium]|nr:methyltransferase domain-containing protein [Rhodovibrionaceae bacterium]
MRFAGLIGHAARPAVRRQRNHDLIFLPQSRRAPGHSDLRIAEETLTCLVYGRFKVSDAQLDRLTAYLRKEPDKRPLRLAVACEGAHFDRLLFGRWLGKQLAERGIKFDEGSHRALRVFCIDQDYYICTEAFGASDATGRDARRQEREGSLPVTVAAAMAFLAHPTNADTVLDPVCGSGSLLAEFSAYAPAARCLGFDEDKDAVSVARKNLDPVESAEIRQGDARRLPLPDGSTSVLLANPPFGKQFGLSGDNPALYTALLAEAVRLAEPESWRGIVITADVDAMAAALRALPQLRLEQQISIKLRGEPAEILRLGLAGQNAGKKRA